MISLSTYYLMSSTEMLCSRINILMDTSMTVMEKWFDDSLRDYNICSKCAIFSFQDRLKDYNICNECPVFSFLDRLRDYDISTECAVFRCS